MLDSDIVCMETISSYMTKSRSQRRAHLDLSTQCDERGGSSTSFTGILALFLDTEIPQGSRDGFRTSLCHACNNSGCCNPLHLYWGTNSDNAEDAFIIGARKSPWFYSVEKYGEEKAREMQGRGNKAAGGKAGLGKSKTKEHNAKISSALSARPKRTCLICGKQGTGLSTHFGRIHKDQASDWITYTVLA